MLVSWLPSSIRSQANISLLPEKKYYGQELSSRCRAQTFMGKPAPKPPQSHPDLTCQLTNLLNFIQFSSAAAVASGFSVRCVVFNQPVTPDKQFSCDSYSSFFSRIHTYRGLGFWLAKAF